MVPNWLKMNRNRTGGWKKRLYQSPNDSKLLADKKRLKAMVQLLVSTRLAEKPYYFSDLEQAFALLHRIRLFLHLYIALSEDLNDEMERKSLSILKELNTERVQLQALSIESVSSLTDAPAKWKASQRRRGVSVMRWRAAVSFAEQSQFASDEHWITQYRYDKSLHTLAERYGGLGQLGASLRSADEKERIDAASKMGEWLRGAGEQGDTLFRAHARLAKKKRFNFAAIDASERSLELARRISLQRAPALAQLYYKEKAHALEAHSKALNWHDRYAQAAKKQDEVLAWKEVRRRAEKALSSFHKDISKAAVNLFSSDHLIQPQGRGGGFTTPVFYNSKGKVEAGPFIYAPFDGSADSARTLAHEMGHGVHAEMSAYLGPMQADAGWAVAETIALTFEQLSLSNDRWGLSDQDFAMLVHQPAIGMFERELGVTDTEVPVDAVWINALRSHYGSEISLNGYEPFWRRHSSSLSAPGYPMAYLLGWVLAGFIVERQRKYPDRVNDPMLEVLKSGGAVGFDDIASQFGVRDISELVHAAYDRAERRLSSDSFSREGGPSSHSNELVSEKRSKQPKAKKQRVKIR